MKKSKKIGPLIGPSIDTFSIIFLLKRKKKNKQKMFPIYSRVTINGERIELSTKRSILLKNWDTKRQIRGPFELSFLVGFSPATPTFS